MAAKAMLSERLLLLLEREIDDFERMAEMARAAEARGEGAAGVCGNERGQDGAVAVAMAANDRGADQADASKGAAACRSPGRSKAASVAAKTSAGKRGLADRPLGSAKERIDALGQLTRTLEKLLDLKRLEKLASEGGQADEAETRRLRAELLARLKSLDMRRREGATLFVGVDADAVFSGDG